MGVGVVGVVFILHPQCPLKGNVALGWGGEIPVWKGFERVAKALIHRKPRLHAASL